MDKLFNSVMEEKFIKFTTYIYGAEFGENFDLEKYIEETQNLYSRVGINLSKRDAMWIICGIMSSRIEDNKNGDK